MKPEHSQGKSAKQLIAENIAMIVKIQQKAEGDRTTGERIADHVAHSIGSWPFILIQSFILVVWIVLNICGAFKAWDPYPFILLNLALSFQAAYASPIIMMSQNRQAKISDQRNHLALQIAMLAEQEDTETLHLIHKICQKLEIPIEKRCKALEAATDPEFLHSQIEKMENDAKK
jgi:uncharacterized membrane protein